MVDMVDNKVDDMVDDMVYMVNNKVDKNDPKLPKMTQNDPK